jgi:guanylate kinase
MILTISGRSGAGKTTLMRRLVDYNHHVLPLLSITTRGPRDTDAPGEYLYISEQEFDRKFAQKEFLKEFGPHGKRFAHRINDITLGLQGKPLMIALLIPSAVKCFVEEAQRQGRESSLASVYLDLDDEEEVRRRLLSRGDLSQEEVEKRIIECRGWGEEALGSSVWFEHIDASQPAEEVYNQALAYLFEIGWSF